MMNLNEKLEIAKRLRLSSEMEMSRDELAQMLEDELAKPEAEMDDQLVQDILELLGDTPTAQQQNHSWKQIEKKLTAKSLWHPVIRTAARIAAAGVILVALTFATYSTARAFNWEFLLRLMKPFTETFMVYSGDDPEPTATPAAAEMYGDQFSSIMQKEFTTLAECPDAINGHPVKPTWMPEQYVYSQGSLYSDMHMTSVVHVFTRATERCIIDITVFQDNNDFNVYQFEQVPDENNSTNVAGYQVTFYRNTDNMMLTASLMVENAHYCITGTLSEEEIVTILESIMK